MATTRQAAATAEFLQQLGGSAESVQRDATRLTRAVATKVGEAVIVGNEFGPGTPVDTGFARGSWWAEIGEGIGTNPAPPSVNPTTGKATEAPAQLTQAAMDRALLAAATMDAGDVLSYNNDAAYIEDLNAGHSQQAPQGVTDSVVAAFPALVEGEARRLGLGR